MPLRRWNYIVSSFHTLLTLNVEICRCNIFLARVTSKLDNTSTQITGTFSSNPFILIPKSKNYRWRVSWYCVLAFWCRWDIILKFNCLHIDWIKSIMNDFSFVKFTIRVPDRYKTVRSTCVISSWDIPALEYISSYSFSV